MPARKKKPIKKPVRKPAAKSRGGRKRYDVGGQLGQSDTGYNAGTQYMADPNSTQTNDRTWGSMQPGGSVGTMVGLNSTEGEDLLTDTVKVDILLAVGDN